MTGDTQSPGLIPDQLLSDIKKGDCVLFLGADLPLGYEGAPPSRPELAAALADEYDLYDLPPESSWPEAARAYLGRFAGDRRGLVSFVAARCSGPRVRPGPLHEAIARAGFRAIVTAWYDDLLEVALRDAGYRVNRVVRDTQLPYAQEGEREAIVVKLYGCLSDPESLVLDTWDHEELMDRLSRKLELVTAFCALRPPLFVGFDPTDRVPMRLYVRASTNMVAHMRRAYAVWSRPLDTVRAAWQGKNVEFRRADAAAFLQALAAQMPPARPGVRGAVRVHRPPYKFLDYYEPGDADIFCGRDTESQVVARLALSHRLLTLFGPSGAGKTSLLLAGVLPRLDAEGYRHVYVRALDDPLPAVRKEIAARAGRADWETGADLRAFLEEMLAPDDKLVVVLDQFEELFLRVGTGRRAGFFRQLAAALDPPEREVRFIFSLREDYLARLDEARADLTDVFANSYRLAALDRPNARVATTEPAARAGVVVEPSLVDALVGGEGREAGDLVEADGHVPPAALQIVLDRLYREALPPGHPPDDPPPPGLTLSLAAYRAVRHRLGEGEEAQELAGAEAILAGYVGEGLARLPELKREDGQTELGADPALGRAILKVMVTSQATKAALTQAEILAWLDEAGVVRAGDAADEALTENTRLGLERVRLLRGFERDGVPLYELAHDHLAAEIATWISEEEVQARLARELLRREMDNWRDAGLLIPPDALDLIYERCGELLRLRSDELELLLLSALTRGYPIDIWASSVRLLEKEPQLRVLKSVAEVAAGEHPDDIRQAAIRFLATVGVEESIPYVIESLFIKSFFVRAAARESLKGFRSESVTRQLAEKCLDTEPKRRLLAALSLRCLADPQRIAVLSQIHKRMTPEQTAWMGRALQIVQGPKGQVLYQTPNMLCLAIIDGSDFASSLTSELADRGHLVDTLQPYKLGFDPNDARVSVETLLHYQIVLLFRGDGFSRYSLLGLKDRLVSFIHAGGTLIATPWVAWEDTGHLKPVLPVLIETPPGYHENKQMIWETRSAHSLCHGLSPTMSFRGSYESLVSVPDAEVLIADNRGNPALALKESGLGRVIYLNVCGHDCPYNPWDESSELRRVFTNIFEWLTLQYCDLSIPDC